MFNSSTKYPSLDTVHLKTVCPDVLVCEVSGEVNLVLMETTPEHSRTKKQAKPSKKPPAGEP
jgi:hypothetical protein